MRAVMMVLLLEAPALAEPRRNPLVRRPGDPDERVQCVGVPADENPRSSTLYTAQDDPGRLLRAHVRQLVELLGELLVVAALGLVGVAGDVGLDATGMNTGDLDRPPGREHLLAECLGEP